MELRPYRESDTAAIEELLGAVWGGDAGAEANQHFGSEVSGGAVFRTVVAEVGGRLGGFGTLSWHSLHPNRSYLTLNVHPDFRRRGIAGRILRRLEAVPEAGLRPWQAATYADRLEALRFLRRAGFAEVMKTTLPVIIPGEVDLEPFAEAEADIQKLGYQVVPLSQLRDPDALERLADLHFRAYAAAHRRNPPGEALYRSRLEVFMGEDLDPEGLFVALKGGEYAGFSSIRRGLNGDDFDFAWMGVSEPHRTHAPLLMLALKKHELEYALRKGIPALHAEIDEPDDPLAAQVFARLPKSGERVWLTLERGGVG